MGLFVFSLVGPADRLKPPSSSGNPSCLWEGQEQIRTCVFSLGHRKGRLSAPLKELRRKGHQEATEGHRDRHPHTGTHTCTLTSGVSCTSRVETNRIPSRSWVAARLLWLPRFKFTEIPFLSGPTPSQGPAASRGEWTLVGPQGRGCPGLHLWDGAVVCQGRARSGESSPGQEDVGRKGRRASQPGGDCGKALDAAGQTR